MTLEKAIEELTQLKGYDEIVGLLSTEEAIDLGIEALKLAQSNRRSPYIEYIGLLPGETEE